MLGQKFLKRWFCQFGKKRIEDLLSKWNFFLFLTSTSGTFFCSKQNVWCSLRVLQEYSKDATCIGDRMSSAEINNFCIAPLWPVHLSNIRLIPFVQWTEKEGILLHARRSKAEFWKTQESSKEQHQILNILFYQINGTSDRIIRLLFFFW